MNQELLSKARAAKTPEELLQLAHENGMEYFTEENAKAYFDILNNGGDKKSGELADEELDSTTGGACRKGLHRVVSRGNVCSAGPSRHYFEGDYYAFGEWKCKTCKEVPGKPVHLSAPPVVPKTCSCNRSTIGYWAYELGVSADFGAVGVCGSCDWCKYVDGVWICTDPYDIG